MSVSQFGGGGGGVAGVGAVGTLGSNSVTTETGSITTVEVQIHSVTVTTVAGRRYRLSCNGMTWQSTATNNQIRYHIKEGSTYLTFQDSPLNSGANNDTTVCPASAVITPSAGSHTYITTALRVQGAGTLSAGGNGSFTSTLLIEDIGT